MAKEQKRKKYQHKQKTKKSQDASIDQKIAHLAAPIIESKSAAGALKRAIQKTVKQ
jgi:hypothetical protein